MKFKTLVCISALSLAAVACSNKKTQSSTVADLAKPGASASTTENYHKIKECPDLNGMWNYDVDVRDGDSYHTLYSLYFSVNSDLNLTFNRVTQENETWVIDGVAHDYPSGNQVTAYCENNRINVEITHADQQLEVLSFTKDTNGSDKAPRIYEKDLVVKAGLMSHALVEDTLHDLPNKVLDAGIEPVRDNASAD